MTEQTRLDHGVLSIPNRTKNINRDLDCYKREQSATAKADHKKESADLKERRAKVKSLLAEWEAVIISRFEGELGTASQIKKMLRSKAHWEPDWLINFIEKVEAEEAASDQWERENL